MIRVHQSILIVALCLGCGQLARAQAGTAEKPATLWSFLGIPQAAKHLHTQLVNRHGRHPGLEPKPPLRAIADPANLPASAAPEGVAVGPASSAGVALASMRNVTAAEPPPPDKAKKAIETAAQIKQAEDLAPQKIKALRYLAKVGCGRPGVVDAFKASIDPKVEANEEVRYAAAQAILSSVADPCCDHCNTASCCKHDLIEKMGELAFKRDGSGCWLEPSDRVRETLQEALQKCCPGMPILEVGEPGPGPDGGKPEPDRPASGTPAGLPAPETSKPKVPPAEGTAPPAAPNGTTNPFADSAAVEFRVVNGSVFWPASFSSRSCDDCLRSPGPLVAAQGTVVRVNPSDQTVEVRCPDQGRAAVGTFATVRREFFSGVETIGSLKVLSAEEGYMVAQPRRLSRPLKEGDEVVLFVHAN